MRAQRPAYDFFHDRGFHVYLDVPYTNVYLEMKKSQTHWQRMHVWFERTRVVYQLLALKYVVIHSDADAIWLKSPLPELHRLSRQQDIIFSRGNAASGKTAGHGGSPSSLPAVHPHPSMGM